MVRLVILLYFVVALVCNNAVLAQNLNSFSGQGANGAHFGWSSFSFGDWGFSPTITLGVQKFGLKIDLEIPPSDAVPRSEQPGAGYWSPYSSLLDVSPLSLKIKDADFWVGGFGIEALRDGKRKWYLKAITNFPRDVIVHTDSAPVIGSDALDRWRGSDLSWTQLDIGGALGLSASTDLVLGLLWEHTSTWFSDPLPTPGLPPLFLFQNLRNNVDSIVGDLSVTNCVLYTGAQLSQRGLRGRFLIGWAGANVNIPLSLNENGLYGIAFGGPLPILPYTQLSETATYSFSKPGYFLQAEFEAKRAIVPRFEVCFWARGSFMSVGGTGSVELENSRSGSLLFFPLFSSTSNVSDTGSARYQQYTVAGGTHFSFRF